MKAYELIKASRSLLGLMGRHSLEVGDMAYLGLVSDYLSMQGEGHKKTYIMRSLSEKHGVSERTVYRVIERLMQEVGE